MDEIREITIDQAEEPKKDLTQFDYVTIPVKEYRKLIRKVEQLKAELVTNDKVAKETHYAESFRKKMNEFEDENEKLREALEDAKSQLRELLGVEELKEEE